LREIFKIISSASLLMWEPPLHCLQRLLFIFCVVTSSPFYLW
jgi:hypothetical protein